MFCRRILGWVACAGMVTNSGCLNPFTNTQKTSAEQKADLDASNNAPGRIWLTDEPSHMDTSRVHGGLID